MANYANRLKELSKDCKYDNLLERQLRDRFATGLNHTALEIDRRQRPDLLEKDETGKLIEVTFQQLFTFAQSREIAESDNIVRRIRDNKYKRTNNNVLNRKLKKDHCFFIDSTPHTKH